MIMILGIHGGLELFSGGVLAYLKDRQHWEYTPTCRAIWSYVSFCNFPSIYMFNLFVSIDDFCETVILGD